MYKDPNDGMTYEWDTKKRAWFPRINEDFLAQYQMNYGFTKDGVAEPTKPEEISPEDLTKTTETGKLKILFLERSVQKSVQKKRPKSKQKQHTKTLKKLVQKIEQPLLQ